MSSTVRLAEGLQIPAAELATQVVAALGMRGSGKSNSMTVIVEGLARAGVQVVVLDYVGIWFGLRLAPDGKKPSDIDIPILGGRHGDIRLVPTGGAEVARALAETASPAVLDVSGFTKGDRCRFATDFAEALFIAKKEHPGPTFLVLEEAQRFIPQKLFKGQERMLGAFEEIAEVGRNYGLGLGLISQRPQKLAKDVLNLTELLLAFQTNGVLERKAISEWVQEKGAVGRKEVDGELPALKRGNALVWSPSWLSMYGRYHIAKKTTYDAGATPLAARAQVQTKPLALPDLEKSMAATIEQAKANDPAELRREVARLRRELDQAQRATPAPAPTPPKVVEVPVVFEDDLEEFREAHEEALRHLTAIAQRVETAAGRMSPPRGNPLTQVGVAGNGRANSPAPAARQPPPPRPPRRGPPGGEAGLGKADRAILTALALRHPTPLTLTQLATLAGYSPSGGGYRNAVSALNTAGRLRREGELVYITDAGLDAIGPQPAPQSPGELLELWCSKIKPRTAADILRWVAHQRRPVTLEEMAEAAGMNAEGGGFRNYVSHLRSNALIQKGMGGYRINEALAQ